jgi:hypothetical protein
MACEFPRPDNKIGQVEANRALRKCSDSGPNQAKVSGTALSGPEGDPEFPGS